MNLRGLPVAQIATEKRRYTILRRLQETPGYEVQRHILMLCLQEQGIPTTADQMDHALEWLCEAEFITLRDAGDARIARLTADGQEVALGHRVVKGVLRPEV